MKKIKFGIPKGSLQKTTIELLSKAGYNIKVNSRSYYPSCDDGEIECILMRAQEIPKYVEDGTIDLGISGFDWIQENNAKVVEVSELLYAKTGLGKVRWVLAAPEKSNINSPKDLKGKKIATELVNVSKRYLKKHNVSADVEFSWGATEVKPPKLADAIIELTETGSTLRKNNLKIIDTVLESTTRLIANKKSYKDDFKKKKITEISTLLLGAINSKQMVGLMMNVKEKDLDKVMKILPAITKPTVSRLVNNKTQDEWVDVLVVLNEKKVREIIIDLKNAGAEGIVEFPLNKVI